MFVRLFKSQSSVDRDESSLLDELNHARGRDGFSEFFKDFSQVHRRDTILHVNVLEQTLESDLINVVGRLLFGSLAYFLLEPGDGFSGVVFLSVVFQGCSKFLESDDGL